MRTAHDSAERLHIGEALALPGQRTNSSPIQNGTPKQTSPLTQTAMLTKRSFAMPALSKAQRRS
jgi:hypothetical protein